MVNMKYLIFNSVKSVIYSKLEFSTSQNRAKTVYKTETGSDGNLNPFGVFRILFLRSTMVELNATINWSIVFKT